MKLRILTLPIALIASVASANEYEPAMRTYLTDQVATWQSSDVIIDAIRAQNRKNLTITQAQIDNLDAAWRAEVGTSDTPTIKMALANEAADFLRQKVAEAGGQITEVFVVDAHGLNVATSSVTSDYWQGDEAKFTETFGKGVGAVHLGSIEFDESSQSYQGQASVVIVDPDTGLPIGAITVGLNAESL